jgi:glycosyltransferase involved in cell wall biosynthesis
MKVLFLTTYPEEDAATRFRVCQFFPLLASRGIHPTLDSIMSRGLYRNKNSVGLSWMLIKTVWLLLSLCRRIVTLPKLWFFDVVFIQREAFPFFTPLVERFVRMLSRRMVFDFDDAVYTVPDGWNNWRDRLRNPANVRYVCASADAVVVGNSILKHYAEQYTKSVTVLPTVYHVREQPRRTKANRVPVVGWIGSWSTLHDLQLLTNVFQVLATKHEFILRIVGAKNIYTFAPRGVTTEHIEWSLDNELELLSSFDIGVMPLFDNNWERGKCGFKLIQYMSVGLPVIGSPVGANKDIILHGENGFLASTDAEWLQYLTMLLSDVDLRIECGNRSLTIIRSRYSIETIGRQLVEVIRGSEDSDIITE